jgi:hypothetical protein
MPIFYQTSTLSKFSENKKNKKGGVLANQHPSFLKVIYQVGNVVVVVVAAEDALITERHSA